MQVYNIDKAGSSVVHKPGRILVFIEVGWRKVCALTVGEKGTMWKEVIEGMPYKVEIRWSSYLHLQLITELYNSLSYLSYVNLSGDG